MIWFFVFFLVSGFCGILYELVWLRLAMAQFGVTTPLVSIVLSMFMAGLGLGSVAAGNFIRRCEHRAGFSPLRFYATCEFLIGISALIVPLQLIAGHRLMESVSGNSGISSGAYYIIAGVWLALTLVPWCACMGATIPLGMAAIRRRLLAPTQGSFSFLYLANLIGAAAGTIIPLLFIEVGGFRRTLQIGTVLNFAVAISAVILSFRQSASGSLDLRQKAPVASNRTVSLLLLLFLTGFSTMGMEVVWIRIFTPGLGPLVYSFATVLGTYLVATFIGSQIYRLWRRTRSQESHLLWASLGLLGLLPLVTADARSAFWWAHPALCVALGVMPFSGVIGFLTPMLVDRWSSGSPDRAGSAYAINVLGCILGPLFAGFLILPYVGESASLLIFVLPFFALLAFRIGNQAARPAFPVFGLALLLAALAVFFLTKDFATLFPQRWVLRDSTATVIASGSGRLEEKRLWVNGVSVTTLSSTTKMMAHLTLASHQQRPQNTLVICFGMGTTFRSALSWGIPTSVIDLIPSVPKAFPYYHPDADRVLASPFAHVIVDDGRRYLERSAETFDSIIIDPPPPVQAAGSSLLYSEEFYSLVKQHLRTAGIFQQWFPGGDRATHAAVIRALQDSFPYIRVFHYKGIPGLHFLASLEPIPLRSASELAMRMPAAAVVDFVEWVPDKSPADQFALVLPYEVSVDTLLGLLPSSPPLRDDRPVNEYYLLRTPCEGWLSGVESLRQHLYSGLSALLEPHS
jgi:spermidine synthase